MRSRSPRASIGPGDSLGPTSRGCSIVSDEIPTDSRVMDAIVARLEQRGPQSSARD
jgi:hypothetical protein